MHFSREGNSLNLSAAGVGCWKFESTEWRASPEVRQMSSASPKPARYGRHARRIRATEQSGSTPHHGGRTYTETRSGERRHLAQAWRIAGCILRLPRHGRRLRLAPDRMDPACGAALQSRIAPVAISSAIASPIRSAASRMSRSPV